MADPSLNESRGSCVHSMSDPVQDVQLLNLFIYRVNNNL